MCALPIGHTELAGTGFEYGSVCLCVHHTKWSDLLQIETKIFLDSPSIIPLRFRPRKVKGEGKDAKIAKTPKRFCL